MKIAELKKQQQKQEPAAAENKDKTAEATISKAQVQSNVKMVSASKEKSLLQENAKVWSDKYTEQVASHEKQFKELMDKQKK